MIDLGTAEQISRGFVGKGKHKLVWRGLAGHMAKDKVKLLLNLVASADHRAAARRRDRGQMAGTLENAELPPPLPRHRRASAAVPGRLRRRRARPAARCA